MSGSPAPVGVVTVVVFERLGRLGRQVIELEGARSAVEVWDEVEAWLARLAPGRELDVLVLLPEGSARGEVRVSVDARYAGTGVVEIRTPDAPPVVYPGGGLVAVGDVVRVGGYGVAFHEVVEVRVGLVRIRETTRRADGRRVAQTVPPGRLVLVERYRGRS